MVSTCGYLTSVCRTANAAAGDTRATQSDTPAGVNGLAITMYGSTTATTTVATAPAPWRRIAPTETARTEAAASIAATPSATRSSVAAVTGKRYTPWARASREPIG